MDRREHHRVQLRIPARLRWTTPLGQQTEVCKTVNVSRGGLLVPCKENHAAGISLWVTFPYDASLPSGQPEVLARVVRSGRAAHTVLLADGREAVPAGGEEMSVAKNGARNGTATGTKNGTSNGDHSYAAAAALRFEIAPRKTTNGNSNGHRELERRTSPRRSLAVPIRVRPENVPWFEETMTLDFSRESLRFLSNREYQPGKHLIVSFEEPAASPWPSGNEVRSLVVRIDTVPPTPALAVTVYRVQ
jgi:PilZ domain